MAKELQEHVERPLLDYREQQKLKRKDVRPPHAAAALWAVVPMALLSHALTLMFSNVHRPRSPLPRTARTCWRARTRLSASVMARSMAGKERRDLIHTGTRRAPAHSQTRKIHQQRMRDAEQVEKAATKAMMNDKKEFSRVRHTASTTGPCCSA